MRIELFQPSIEGEARLLLLIETFSRKNNALEGRTKLAKLDFLLRYPTYLHRALRLRGVTLDQLPELSLLEDIETRMVRYRYGPWDPAYFAILGRLIGKGLIKPVPLRKGIGYSATEKGREIAKNLRAEPVWEDIMTKLELLRKHLDLAGTALKKFIYEHFPEVTKADWGERL